MLELEDLPESDSEIQDADTCYGASNPSGGHHCLQSVVSGLARSIEQKIVVAPVTESQGALRDPRQQSEDNADLEAKDYVEDYA